MTHDTSTVAWALAHPDERAPVPPTPDFRPRIVEQPLQSAEHPKKADRLDVIAIRRSVMSEVPAPRPAPLEPRGAPESVSASPPVSWTGGLSGAPRSAIPATLLVVDDDENLLRMLRRGLAFAGYSVRIAADGDTALRLALEKEPDLIVFDVMLPEPLDGLEVARRLRAGGSDVPVLMLTAREQLADKMAGFASGADDYLPKPFAFEELLARVAALLRRRPHSSATSADELLRYADLSLNPITREVWRGGERIELTAREFDVVAYFLRHRARF